MLTIDKLKDVHIPINVYNKPNNLQDASRGIQLYNDSVNLWDAIQLVGVVGTSTDLSYSVTGNIFTLFSSTGADTLIPLVTTVNAGLMSPADKIKLNTVLTSATLVLGPNMIGDGSALNPLDWAGAFTLGPITGSGTSFAPITVLNNSITSNHITNGTILFQDLNQNGAALNQVPVWNGTAWAATTLNGLLPPGVAGNTLFHNGTSWVALSRVEETRTNTMGPNINSVTLPNTIAPISVYRNGSLQTLIEDYSRSGQTFTFVSPLINLDRITLIYFA